MAQKKNYYYVLVMTNSGPTFVTKVNHSNKTAEWNKLEKPLELEKFWAEDLVLGLNLNLNVAFMVCSKFQIDYQPYLYDRGQFEWVYKKEEEEK